MSLLPARMQINDPLPLLGEKVTPSVATARPTPEQVFETYSHDKMVPGGATAPKPPLARNWTDEAIAEMLGDAWLHATWLSANPPVMGVDIGSPDGDIGMVALRRGNTLTVMEVQSKMDAARATVYGRTYHQAIVDDCDRAAARKAWSK